MDITDITDMAIQYGLKVVYAITILLVGLSVIKFMVKVFNKTLKKRGIDPTLAPFLRGIVSIGLKSALIISILGIVGVKTTSFVALLGAAGLAIGMSLQGSLSNFAGGVLILIFRPFKVGDVIEAQGHIGKVQEIGIFCSKLKTGDNKVIFIPNGPLANGSMTNYSTETTRRVDWIFGIAYSDKLKQAQESFLNILNNHNKVLQDPAPFARVSELADNSVNFTVRAWVNADDYWDVYFDVIESVKLNFDQEGLNFPFPQRDVHLHQVKS